MNHIPEMHRQGFLARITGKTEEGIIHFQQGTVFYRGDYDYFGAGTEGFGKFFL